MRPEDMFVLDAAGNVLETPEARPPPYKPPKLSECSPLFMAAYNLRNAGAVIHSHSFPAVMATMLDPSATEFRCTHLEMIKGIAGHSFHGGCVVPIIENTARECELTERLEAAIKMYPQSNGELSRGKLISQVSVLMSPQCEQ
jgi:methylthioribulose 1-phosphate dehydratase / enolase-phosphatase E1